MRKAVEPLTSRRNVAVMLTILGQDVAAEVVRHFEEEQIEALSVEIARLEKVTSEQREQIILEFHDMAMAQDYIAEGRNKRARFWKRRLAPTRPTRCASGSSPPCRSYRSSF